MTEIDLSKLAAPFPGNSISWRVGSTTKDKSKGMALAYIDARDVQDRLDKVCGPENWMNRYPHANGKTVCEIGIRINGEWIWKADGAGDSDVEAEKGALSDAFKRAAVRWGVGRYLYDLDSPWVELEAAGNSVRIKASEMARLAKLVGGKALPPQPPAPAEPKPSGVNVDDLRSRARPVFVKFKDAKTQDDADALLADPDINNLLHELLKHDPETHKKIAAHFIKGKAA